MPKNYYWDENKEVYRASIDRDGKTYNIGSFKDELDAKRAVAFWKAKYHQEKADQYYDEYTAILALQEEREQIAREREEILDSLEEYERDDV